MSPPPLLIGVVSLDTEFLSPIPPFFSSSLYCLLLAIGVLLRLLSPKLRFLEEAAVPTFEIFSPNYEPFNKELFSRIVSFLNI